MANYPYASNPGRLKELLQKTQDLGVPTKVTNKYLESLGYKSKNDRAMVGVLRSIGFIDASGTPTDVWRKYRNKAQAKAVMATILKDAYKELFATYPDAYRRDNEALRNFFSTHTTVGEGGLRFMVSTFKSLTELADFGAPKVELEEEADEDPIEIPQRHLRKDRGQKDTGVVLAINIQLQIPETDKADVYDNFFAAMKKHLLA